MYRIMFYREEKGYRLDEMNFETIDGATGYALALEGTKVPFLVVTLADGEEVGKSIKNNIDKHNEKISKRDTSTQES